MNNPYSLNDKYFVVTGASSGIGAVTARILSEQGGRIILVGRNEGKLQMTLEKMANPKNHLLQVFDLNVTDAIPNWLKDVSNQVGSIIHGLAHFAGIHQTIPLRVLSKDNMDSIMNANVYSALALLRACSNKLVFASGGSIVLASSVMGMVGQAGVVSYAASKGAINSIVKSAALELVRNRIRVNGIAPGMVRTDMFDEMIKITPQEQYEKNLSYHPLGFGDPEDVAYATHYLLSDASKWVTGTTLVVDGGYSCH